MMFGRTSSPADRTTGDGRRVAQANRTGDVLAGRYRLEDLLQERGAARFATRGVLADGGGGRRGRQKEARGREGGQETVEDGHGLRAFAAYVGSGRAPARPQASPFHPRQMIGLCGETMVSLAARRMSRC